MGTRSWLRIKRRKHADVYLWAHWDGHFDGVGKTLCQQLRVLLAGHTQAELCAAIEAMRVSYEDETDAAVYDVAFDDGHSFKFDKLAAVVGLAAVAARGGGAAAASSSSTSTGVVRNSHCNDVEYTYTLDPYAGVLMGAHASRDMDAAVILTFEQLRSGADFATAVISDDDAKLKILDVCRVFAGTDVEAAAAIDALVASEGTYCLSEWSEEAWLEAIRKFKE